MLSTDPTINEWKNVSDNKEEMSKSCWITEPQSYLSFYSCVFLFFIMLFFFLLFEVTLFLRNPHFLLRSNAISIDNHLFLHFITLSLFFVGLFYVIYDEIVWMSVLNTYLKWKCCIWGGRASIMINNPAESFFSSAEILLMFVLDAHSFRALVQTFITSVLDQCNSTLYGTLSKLHQHWISLLSPH